MPEVMAPIPAALEKFANHGPIEKKRPMFMDAAFARADGEAVLALALKAARSLGVIADGWNGFNVLHTAASRVGGLDIGFVPGEGGRDAVAMTNAGGADLIFRPGRRRDRHRARRVRGLFRLAWRPWRPSRGRHSARWPPIPKCRASTSTRRSRAKSNRACFAPGEAREGWAVLRALSAVLGKTLPFDTLAESRAKPVEAVPHLGAFDHVARADVAALGAPVAGALSPAPFSRP